MVYIGDGLTDIPCFFVINQNGGTSFGIWHTGRSASAKINILKQILKTKRVLGTYAPKYGSTQELGQLIRIAVQTICSDIVLEKARA